MNSVITQNTQLPLTVEDLSRFVLKPSEAQDIADAVLNAEVKISELMNTIPKVTCGNHGNQQS